MQNMIKGNKDSNNYARYFCAKLNQIPCVKYLTANNRNEKISNYNLIAV
jgi:hypothetical protein|tara:strand:+ start:959 stop:1105 length:147 start_codon:yes stop_codon:yes gene_type:complete